MFDRIICVLVRMKVRGHLVMSIIQFMHLISVHFWTYLTSPLKQGRPISSGPKVSTTGSLTQALFPHCLFYALEKNFHLCLVIPKHEGLTICVVSARTACSGKCQTRSSPSLHYWVQTAIIRRRSPFGLRLN